MRGVGVEEAAAIGAEHLDRFLAGDRTERDGLLHAFQRGRVDRHGEGLRNPAQQQIERVDDADRQQQIERDARDIGPEIADPGRRGAARRRIGGRAPGEPAEKREGDGDAGRRAEKVVDRQGHHLAEVRHGRFPGIPLPVGIGDEGDGGVHRTIRADPGQLALIERQEALRPQDQIGQQHGDQLEHQHVYRIAAPALVLVRIDP